MVAARRPKERSEVARFGIVLPVHNEERLLLKSLAALERAYAHASHSTRATAGVAVVLDGCTDLSGSIATDWARDQDLYGEVEIIETAVRNVGRARRAGCARLLSRWSAFDSADIWLSTTDADSEVPRDWISAQLEARREGAQVWAGAVEVTDWSDRAAGTAAAWQQRYGTEHMPIHGASLGIDASTYIQVGGFEGLPSSEDRALFDLAMAHGAVIRTDPTVRVRTSGRRDARAPHGFAHALTMIEAAMGDPVGTPMS